MASTTGDLIVAGARTLLGDMNAADPVVGPEILRLSVDTQVSQMALDIGMGPKWVRNAVLLTTADHDYVLPGDYARVLEVAYSRDYYPLQEQPLDTVIRMRAGYKGNGGRQFVYALDVNENQETVLMLVYKPNESEYIDLYVSQLPDVWGPMPAASPTFYFSPAVQRALELRVAADVGGTLGPDRMIALALNPNVPDKWNASADKLVRSERIKLNGIKRSKMVSRTTNSW